MTDKTQKVSALRAAFGTLELSRDGDDVSVKCPKCAKPGSSKKKLVINLEKGMYHCWVCGIKGRNVVKVVRMVSASAADHPVFKKWSKNSKPLSELDLKAAEAEKLLTAEQAEKELQLEMEDYAKPLLSTDGGAKVDTIPKGGEIFIDDRNIIHVNDGGATRASSDDKVTKKKKKKQHAILSQTFKAIGKTRFNTRARSKQQTIAICKYIHRNGQSMQKHVERISSKIYKICTKYTTKSTTSSKGIST